MNLLENLPSLSKDEVREEIATEEELRQSRIEFHRSRVRNGPAKFSEPTSGQIRRAKKRALNRQTKAAKKNQHRRYFNALEQASILRGHLQAAGVLSYASPDFKPRPEAVLLSVTWLAQHFADQEQADENGQIQLTATVVVDAIQAAYSEHNRLIGAPDVPLSPAYVLPVRLAV